MRISKKQMKIIDKYINKYKSLFGFSDWDIKVANNYSKKEDINAEITYDRYEKVLGIIFDEVCKDMDDEELEKVVVHELTHVTIAYQMKSKEVLLQKLLNYIQEGLEENEEQLAVRLTKAVLRR